MVRKEYRDRSITVIFRSKEELEHFKSCAEKAGMKLSPFVLAMAYKGLEEKPSKNSEILGEVKALKDEIESVKQEIRVVRHEPTGFEKYRQKIKDDLRQYIREHGWAKFRPREPRVIAIEELIKVAGLNPSNEKDLEFLYETLISFEYDEGLIEKSQKGYKLRIGEKNAQ